MIKPFIFNSSKEKSDDLLKALEKIGLERKEVRSFEKELKWELSCPWKEDKVNLVWEKSYCSGGEILEDSSLSIYINNTMKTRIDFKDLLGKKHAKPIRTTITEIVEEELKKYTGKA